MRTYITNRGFTLIELLVVIAIIGILASVVLASLNSARDKGADASIKSSINNGRAQAELYYDDNGNAYDTDNTDNDNGVCADQTIDNIEVSVNNAGGTFACAESDAAYRLSSPLVSDNTVSYCVDSTGKATTTGSTISGTACP